MTLGIVIFKHPFSQLGKTFKNSFVIADEMQNSTPSQMKMLLTRLGENSRIIATGDLNQHDKSTGSDGLRDVLQRMEKSEFKSGSFSVVRFGIEDVERHPVVKEVLQMYGEVH